MIDDQPPPGARVREQRVVLLLGIDGKLEDRLEAQMEVVKRVPNRSNGVPNRTRRAARPVKLPRVPLLFPLTLRLRYFLLVVLAPPCALLGPPLPFSRSSPLPLPPHRNSLAPPIPIQHPTLALPPACTPPTQAIEHPVERPARGGDLLEIEHGDAREEVLDCGWAVGGGERGEVRGEEVGDEGEEEGGVGGRVDED